jgi:hypothetical protein
MRSVIEWREWRTARSVPLIALAWAIVVALNCGGGDSAGPGDGSGGGEKTVLSAATSDGWSMTLHGTERRDANCTTYTFDSTNIGDVWIAGGFSVVTQSRTGNNCCQGQYKYCRIESKRFDLSGYTKARFRATLRMYSEHYVEPGGWRIHTLLGLKSNVPNSPGLDLINEDLYAEFAGETLVEKNIDVSVENAIGYKEASISMSFEVSGGCGGTAPDFLWNQVYVELTDLKIVATK